MYGLPPMEEVPAPDRFLDEDCAAGLAGEHTIKVGTTIAFRVIFTPGHCPGHVVFYDESASQTFVGDLIFKESVGRTDLPLCDPAAMRDSLKLAVETLPDGCALYPGHMGPTTMGDEKASNPFLQDL